MHDKRLCQTAPCFPDSVVKVALCSASALLLSLCAVSALLVSFVSVDLYLYLILYVDNVYPEKDMMQYCNLSHQHLVCHIPFRGLKLSAGYLNFRIPFFLTRKLCLCSHVHVHLPWPSNASGASRASLASSSSSLHCCKLRCSSRATATSAPATANHPLGGVQSSSWQRHVH